MEIDTILQSGLLLSLCTYADSWDGPRTVEELKALQIPAGVTVWLDIESIGADVSPQHVIDSINSWADAVIAGGFQPGLYVGAGVGLTASQLYALRVVRYFRSMSLVPEPACGFSMSQYGPSFTIAGTLVDIDLAHEDYRGRRATFVGYDPSQVDTKPDLVPASVPTV